LKIFYVSNNQLPTKKAHGIQMVKMWEAFNLVGAECELIYPDRAIDPEIGQRNISTFYSLDDGFKSRPIKSLNLVHFQFIPFLGKILFVLQQFYFAKKVGKILSKESGIIYTRDQFVAKEFIGTRFKVYWEIHNLSRNIYDIISRETLHRLDGIVVITENLRNELSKYYSGKILVARDGVDFDKFDVDLTKEDARFRLGLPVNKKIAMYVGHAYGWKGLDVLSRASEYFSEDEDLFLIGNHEKTAGKNINFIDHIAYDLVPTYLKAADCLLLTGDARFKISSSFTSPLKMFEYMTSKRPIVAQRLDSFSEVLNLENSILVDPDNPEALYRGIKKAFYDQPLGAKISKNAYEEAKKFTWLNRARSILDFVS